MHPVIQTAQETINRLTAQNIRIIILLTHIGYEQDRLLARSVTGADIIVGGHSHTLLGNFQDLGLTPEGPYPTMVTAPNGADVLVVHAWKHTRLLGRLSVDFDASGRIISHQGSPCLIAGTPLLDKEDQPLDLRTQERVRRAINRDTRMALPEADPTVAAIAGAYSAQVAEQGDIVVGRTPHALPHIRVPDSTMPQGSVIAPLIAEALKRKVNRNGFDVDIAIQNAGGVRTGLRAGEITIETIYNLLPFENTLVIFQMTGQQINTLLEDAVGAVFDEQRFFGGFPYTSGLGFRIDPAAGKGNRISGCQVIDGSGIWHPMNNHKIYGVVVNRFLADGGDGYTAFNGLKGYDTGFIDTQAFLEYVSAEKTLDSSTQNPFFQTP
jgi:5'-nucleotidase